MTLQHFKNYASCWLPQKETNLFSYGAFVLQYILAHAQQFLTEFSTRQKRGITHVTTHVITCYREKGLCSNMFWCVLSRRDHYKPNLGNDLWNKRTQMIFSQLIQRLRFICHGPGDLLQAFISVQIVGMPQRKVNRETQRGGALLSISRHSPLSERLKLVTSIREFKIPHQL